MSLNELQKSGFKGWLNPNVNSLSFTPSAATSFSYSLAPAAPAQNVSIGIIDPGVASVNLALLGGGSVATPNPTIVSASLSASQSGKTFFLGANAGTVTLTLPSASVGLRYVFIQAVATLGHNVVVTGGAGLMNGTVIPGDLAAATAITSGAASTNINFLTAGSKLGDKIEVVSDGTNWYASGIVSLHTGASFS